MSLRQILAIVFGIIWIDSVIYSMRRYQRSLERRKP